MAPPPAPRPRDDAEARPPLGPDPALGAVRHVRTREARAREKAEDYVEAVADLLEERGTVRVAELARFFGVSHVTVIRTMDRLERDGLLTRSPADGIRLTEEGLRIAAWSKRRHEIVLRFLRAIGIDEETAQLDAEGIEHYVSPATLDAFARVADRLEGDGDGTPAS